MLGHELTHIRNGDVRMLVIAVIIAGVIGFFAELLFRMMFQGGWRWGGGRSAPATATAARAAARRHHHRHRAGGGGVAAVGGDPLRAVAQARVSRRRRLGRADQGPRRHDLGAAQDRRPRRAGGRNLRGHGNVHRQSPRGLCRPVRHPSVDRKPDRRADSVCRRPRSRPARPAGGPRRIAAGRAQEQPEQPAPGPWSADAPSRPKPFLPAEPPVTLGGQIRPASTGPWGPPRQS